MADNTNNTDSTVNKVDISFNGLQTFVETDSRGLGTRAPVLGDSGVDTQYIEIPTPAWFTDSFLRSIKRNSYFNMINASAVLSNKQTTIDEANTGTSLDFYKESNNGVISGIVKNTAKSILSTASNQIISLTSKADSLLNGIKSVFSKDSKSDIDKIVSETSNTPFLAAQPYLTIYGIHLTESLRDNIASLQYVVGELGKLFSNDILKSIGTMDTKDIFKSIEDKCVTTLKKFLNWKTNDSDLKSMAIEMFNNNEYRMHGMAEVLLNCIVSGTYTMKCKLPFLSQNSNNNNPILKSSGHDGFIGVDSTLDDNKLINGIDGVTGFNTVWSNPIDWSPKTIKSHTPLDMSFFIFNDTLEHTLLNLFFIWSFGATTKAVTDTFFIRPPYLYNIEIPGGFRYKYCKCKFSVVPKGKLRKLSPFENGTDNLMTTLFENIFGKSVNPKAIEYVPDVYQINISFTSILPDLWNYMDTYLYNKEMDNVTLGTRIHTKMAQLVESYTSK